MRHNREEVIKQAKREFELLEALREAPEAYFSGKERGPEWPSDVDGHSEYHRVKDIEEAVRR